MSRHDGLGRGLSNRDRTRDAAIRKMPQHGVGLKKVVLTSHHKRVRKRGGIREVRGESDGVRADG